MKTFLEFFKEFIKEEYDYTNVKNPSTGKYLPRDDNKHSYLTGINQPAGGNITFTPGENEETIKTKKSKNRKKHDDTKRTNGRATNKVHLSRTTSNRNSECN